MDASDIIRRNLQATRAAAKVQEVILTYPTFLTSTTGTIVNVSTMTFASEGDKMEFEAGMKYISFTNGVPTLSTMNFCAVRRG